MLGQSILNKQLLAGVHQNYRLCPLKDHSKSFQDIVLRRIICPEEDGRNVTLLNMFVNKRVDMMIPDNNIFFDEPLGISLFV